MSQNSTFSEKNDMIKRKLRFSLRKLAATTFRQKKQKLINKKRKKKNNKSMLYNDLTKQTKAHNKRIRVRYKLSLSESYETVLG